MAGFGGGSKIILPGVCSFETVDHNHQRSVEAAVAALKASPEQRQKAKIGMGIWEENPVPPESDEAMKMVGLDFMVNTLINKWGESTAIYAGEPFAARGAAIKEAKSHYAATRIRNKDIAIANTFAKSNEGLLGLMAALPSVKTTVGADIIFITNTPDGQVSHYLVGKWGTMNFAKQYQKLQMPPFLNHIIVYNEYPHFGSRWLEPSEKVVYISRWDEVLKLLEKSHGPDTSVVVYPNSDIQYFV
jgi:nickel-dependent lactate racemase